MTELILEGPLGPGIRLTSGVRGGEGVDVCDPRLLLVIGRECTL